MSYFFGTAGTCTSIKTGKLKLNKYRSSSNTRENLLGIQGLQNKKKHKNYTKYILKPKSFLKESLKDNNKGNNLYIKTKSKYYLYKEICRLFKENRSLTTKLEETELDLEKDNMLSKLKKKYQKLKHTYDEINTEHIKTNTLLIHQEDKFRQLYMDHEKCILINRNFEQERNNIITVVQKLKNDNIQLNEDVNLLKNVIFYLNIEIEKYQDKLRTFNKIIENQPVISNVDKIEVYFENKNDLKAWGKVNIHVLGPLLDAYQENINEKNQLIKKYKNELDIYTGKMKEIISENNNLYTEIENLKRKYDSYDNEMELIQKDVSIIKEQNDVLTKQSTIQKQIIQEISNAREKKIQLISQDSNMKSKEYFNYKNELSNLKSKYDVLNETHEKLKSKPEQAMPKFIYNITIEECKKLFEELKYQYESDKQKLNTRIKYLEEIQPENEKQQFTLIMERDQLRIQGRNLEYNLKQMQHKVQYLQRMNHTIKLSRDSFKQQLNKTTSCCEKLIKVQKKLIQEKKNLLHLLDKRRKENEDVQHLGNSIIYRMGTLKNQLNIIEKGAKIQLASIEKQIKNQELSINHIKAKYKRELQKFKQLLQQKEEVIQSLQKEKYTMQDHLELMWKAAIFNDKKVKNVLRNNNICI